jgi:hypothetical protein
MVPVVQRDIASLTKRRFFMKTLIKTCIVLTLVFSSSISVNYAGSEIIPLGGPPGNVSP